MLRLAIKTWNSPNWLHRALLNAAVAANVVLTNVSIVSILFIAFVLPKLIESICDFSEDVVQNGVQHRLEVFKTEKKGWGVRSKTDLPEGAFICHYAGDLLEVPAADLRDLKYQFKLPKLKPNSNSDEESDSSSDDDSESDAEPAAKIARNDDVVQPFLNYFPPMQNGNADKFPEPEYIESNEELKQFVIDGLKNGNISRYVNVRFDTIHESMKEFFFI